MKTPLLLLLATSVLTVAAAEKSPAAPKEKPGGGSSSFQWLEEPKSPEAATWLTFRALAARANDKLEVAKGLTTLLQSAEVTVPCAKDGVFFFAKRGPGEKAASIYRRKGLEGTDERLLDAAKLGAAKSAALTIDDLSGDGSLLVYGAAGDKTGERTIHFFDLSAGRDLPDVLPVARYNTVTLSEDKKGAWYAKVSPAGTRVFFHTFGTETSADKYMFGESYNYEPLGPKDSISTELTTSGENLLLSVRRGAAAKRVDLYEQAQEEPDERVRPIIHGLDNRFAWVSHGEDLYVLTDNEAPKQRVVKLMINDPNPKKWQTIVPEGEDVLTGIEMIGDRLFVTGTHAGSAHTRIFNLEGKELGRIVTPMMEFTRRVYHACPAD